MTDRPITIRRLDENDSRGWLDLRKLLWDQLSEQEHLVEMLDIFNNPDTQLILVAVSGNGDIVGFLEASIRPFVEDCHTDHVGYLEGWFVLPTHRRGGVGRALVLGAEQWARENGCVEMASDSEVGNELSLSAHLKLGYTETSRLVHLRKEIT
jgi:aminoglycoside 6'-N-acetyltransferase I